MAKTLDQEMINCFQQLNEIEKKSIVLMLKAFLSGQREPTKRISIEQYNIEIDQAMEEVKKGEIYSQDEVIEMSKNW